MLDVSVLEAMPIYWFCSLLGSAIFLTQLILNFMGSSENDYDDGGAGDIGKFKWLSKQGLTGFMMMFGLTGLTCQYEFKFSQGVTLSIAVLIGFIMLFLTAFIFKTIHKLQSPGYAFKIEDAIGKEAIVYHKIPNGGLGKITISLQSGTFELNATSNKQQEICSFTLVEVIKKMDDNTVVVAPLSK